MVDDENLLQTTELAPEHQQTLRRQAITQDGPGTVLHDFETLLDFIGPTGIEVGSTRYFLPINSLPHLNARLRRSVQLALKRPLQKSYPHINGLYLLLRASGMTQVEKAGAKPRLMVDEAVLEAWRRLNLTERYFTLLEAWLLRGRLEIIGERGGWRDHPIMRWADFFQRIPNVGLSIAGDKSTEEMIIYFPGLFTIALLELFGLVSVQDASPEAKKGWRIARVQRTELGDALLSLLLESLSAPESWLGYYEEPTEPTFGALQPLVQPHFPEWRNNLVLPELGFQQGAYIFKVSLGRIWRRIAVAADMTLDDLATSILNAYEFDFDHLYEFTYPSRFGWTMHAHHPYLEGGPYATEVLIGDLPLKPGGSMTYLYDFGDNWQFDVTLERIDPPDPQLTEPALLEEHGQAPEQYPSWDDEYEDEWSEEE